MRTRTLTLIALVVALAALVVAVSTDVAEGATPRRVVVVVGDSLTVAATDEHQAIAASRGYQAQDYARRGGSMMHNMGAVGALGAQSGGPVVLALGTNDAAYARWVDPLPYWRAALDALRGRCVVVVAWQRHTVADAELWARLAPELATRGVRVYDWHTAAQGAPWVLGPDGVHHSALGEQAYGWALDAAQALCR